MSSVASLGIDNGFSLLDLEKNLDGVRAIANWAGRQGRVFDLREFSDGDEVRRRAGALRRRVAYYGRKGVEPNEKCLREALELYDWVVERCDKRRVVILALDGSSRGMEKSIISMSKKKTRVRF